MSVEMQTKPEAGAESPYRPSPAAPAPTHLVPPKPHDAPSVYEGETNRAAILALLFGGLSILGLAFPLLLLIPIIGMILAGIAYWQLVQAGEEGSGHWAANAGFGLCAAIFVLGAGWNILDYATEVPEGALRLDFFDLQPSEDHPELPIPPSALDLNGKQIFIKGYVFPDGQGEDIKNFILVPDQGTCCFGGNPKATDMIYVKLKDPLRTRYSWNMRKLAGVLKVDPRLRPASGKAVHYILEADYVQ